jgi:thiosulfate dehydrogenase
MRGFIFGIIFTLVAFAVGGYLFVRGGGISLATTAQPLPLEQTVANMALQASIDGAKNLQNPLPLNDDNMVAAVKVYKGHCVMCHGAPGQPAEIAKMMFPHPPQLFTPDGMVTDDPEGVTYWKVTHGIRLSGMPGFGKHLNDNERWRVTMLLKHADKLPAAAQAEFTRKDVTETTMHENHEHEHAH